MKQAGIGGSVDQFSCFFFTLLRSHKTTVKQPASSPRHFHNLFKANFSNATFITRRKSSKKELNHPHSQIRSYLFPSLSSRRHTRVSTSNRRVIQIKKQHGRCIKIWQIFVFKNVVVLRLR